MPVCPWGVLPAADKAARVVQLPRKRQLLKVWEGRLFHTAFTAQWLGIICLEQICFSSILPEVHWMCTDSSFAKKCVKIAAAALWVRPKTSHPLTTRDDNSRNLWKPKAFSDTREVLFPKRKELAGMMGSKVETLGAIAFGSLKMPWKLKESHRGS